MNDGKVIDLRAPSKESRKAHGLWADYTTRGNGERVVDAHGKDLRHAPAAGWFEFDGTRWAPDPEAKRATKRAMDVLIAAYLEAQRTPGVTSDDLKFCWESQKPAAWAAALKTASLYPPIATTFDAFDDGPQAPAGHEFRLNVANGTIDLRRRELKEHRREDMITKLAPVRFEASANPATWDAFLAAAQPDPEIRHFLQRLAGYWLGGAIRDEVFPIFWGQGGNGKGTFLDTLRRMLGDYAGAVPEEVLVASKNRPHPTGMMIFRGLRLAVASETDEGDQLAISTLKRLTGGDVITARLMGRDFVEFEPTHKLVLMTNARPRLSGNVTPSLRRRIFFVPWDTVFEGAAIDRTLKPRLSEPAALSAVLNWALDGYQEWARIGLAPPRSILAATEDYMESEDTIGAFVHERCEFGADLAIPADELYKAYRAYCKDVSETLVVRHQDFKAAFLGKEACKAAGAAWKRSNRMRQYLRVALRPRDADDYAAKGLPQRSLGPWGAS